MPNTSDDHPFSMFAAELSRNLPLITTLLREHPATGDCTGCRLPGARVAIPARARKSAAPFPVGPAPTINGRS